MTILLHIQQAITDNIAVGLNAECAHQNEQWNRFADVGDADDNLVVGELRGGANNTDADCTNRLGRVFRYGADFSTVAVELVALIADIKHIIGELLLRNNALLFAVNDEVPAVVVAAFTQGLLGWTRHLLGRYRA